MRVPRALATPFAPVPSPEHEPESPAEEPLVRLQLGLPRDFEVRFELLEEIGRGGYGTVFRAEARSTRQEFAVKVIRKEKLTTPARRKRARLEMDTMKMMGSSLSIATLYGAYEDDANVYLVQELCRGGVLWERIRSGQYSEAQAADIVRQVLRAVAQCHARGVMIRDIKPHNFLFLDSRPDAPLKLTDFGLATYFDAGMPADAEPFDERVGTSHYMAPEVVGRLTSWPPESRYGPKADLWSVGVLVHQLLSGRLPFTSTKADTLQDPEPSGPSCPTGQFKSDVFAAIMLGKLDMEAEPWPQISEDARALVQRLLQTDPKQRPTAVEALRSPWLRGKAPTAPLSDELCVLISSSLRQSALQRIQRFGGYSRFKRAALRQIASRHVADVARTAVPGLEAQDLRALFEMLDDDGCGRITLSELVDGLRTLGFALAESEAAQLMSILDVTDSGGVDYEELLAALVDWQLIQEAPTSEWAEWAKEAFNRFDSDGSGTISSEEIAAALPGSPSAVALDTAAALRDGDRDGDGVLNLSDWMYMLQRDDVRLDMYDARTHHLEPEATEPEGGAAAGC